MDGKSGAVMSADVYPPGRPPFFAMQLMRDILDRGEVSRMGARAYTIVSAVALMEDQERYKHPIVYSNTALRKATGITCQRTFLNARASAVDSGWLMYQPGSQDRQPVYWVRYPDVNECNSVSNETDMGDEGNPGRCQMRPKVGVKRHPNSVSNETAYIPTLKPKTGSGNGSYVFQKGESDAQESEYSKPHDKPATPENATESPRIAPEAKPDKVAARNGSAPHKRAGEPTADATNGANVAPRVRYRLRKVTVDELRDANAVEGIYRDLQLIDPARAGDLKPMLNEAFRLSHSTVDNAAAAFNSICQKRDWRAPTDESERWTVAAMRKMRESQEGGRSELQKRVAANARSSVSDYDMDEDDPAFDQIETDE